MKKYYYLILCLILMACGSDKSEMQGNPETPFADVSIGGEPYPFTFDLSINVFDSQGEIVADVDYPESRSLPVYVSESGQMGIVARDLQPVVFRVCPQNSTRDDCSLKLNDAALSEDIGEGIDIVVDLCGDGLDDSQCGNLDDTIFKGSMSLEGAMLLNGVSARLRLFGVDEDINGFNATSSDEGILPGLTRIIVKLTSDNVVSGDISLSGSPLENNSITLVGAGKIPEALSPENPMNFVITLNGSFENNPTETLIANDDEGLN